MIKVGHRGAKGYEPENTLLSFQKAIELGADMIEFDVHVCGTGEIVVIHDEDVNRTTNGKGKVAHKSLADLKELNAGKGSRIPTLEEVLDFSKGRIKLDIELKGYNCATSVADMIEAHIRTNGLNRNEILVTSFEHETLLMPFRKASPGTSIGLLFRRVPDNFTEKAAQLGAEYVVLYHKNTDEKIVEKAHKNGLKVMVWTVNKREEIERARKIGVDGIASDFPDMLNGL
jgi:glycerophosphoryl diester phosphodiesterase